MFIIHVIWDASIKSCMGTRLIIKREPVFEGMSQFFNAIKLLQIETLVFNRAPKSFDHDIIHPSTFRVHGDFDFMVLQNCDEVIGCILASLICVKDLRNPISPKRLYQRFHTESAIKSIG